MMPSTVHSFCLQLGMFAPQKKDNIPPFVVQRADGCICELLPTFLGMRVGLVRSDCHAYI